MRYVFRQRTERPGLKDQLYIEEDILGGVMRVLRYAPERR